ncbi:hypothetical protein HN709_02845 [Candidatus Peregrinibacteria bacterium]|jgi:hypothetical protein|nr:hypothetical protein [Candidatus Peregrinibacteria bacterium]
MMQNCKFCKTPFEISDDDLGFYKKLNVPVPTLCPDDRLRRRLSWRNERTLYHRTCDFCEKSMVALYPEDSSYTVYCQDCWWSDKWDPKKYGRDFDFSRGFFEQFDELMHEVPMYGLVNDFGSLENSDYVNYVTDGKNCYLTFAANFLEDVMYSSYVWQSKNILDCSYSTGLELCYDCIDCDLLYHCRSLQNSKNCSDCMFGLGLSGCKHCFGCVNLNSKEYHFYNEPLEREEYEKRIEEILSDFVKVEEERKKFEQFTLNFPRKFALMINCDGSTGNCIKNCKNCFECFEGYGGEDIKWVINFPGALKDSYDISGCKDVEMSVDSAVCFGHTLRYCNSILNSASNLTLCAYMDSGYDMFGCIGMKKGSYSILNKQYSREDYGDMVLRIVDHMKNTEEWGEFFPMRYSPFAYNETVANEYFPMGREEALTAGFRWNDPDLREYGKSAVEIPRNIEDVTDDILDKVLGCKKCNRNYKVNPEELKFYRRQKIAVPELCHQCRHENRLVRRSGRKLWQRTCDKCGDEISSIYHGERREKVYCGKCYLEEIY